MASNILGQSSEPSGSTVEIWITPVVEREFKRREVFPLLRSENAARFVNGATAVHFVPIDVAEAVLQDAEQQRRNRQLPRGLPVAFSSLAQRLTPAIKHAKGLWDDPGIAEALRRAEEDFARFEVGDAARYWSEHVGDPIDGERVVITGAYTLRTVPSKKGVYVDRNGERINYRWGYLARLGGREYFVPAYQLQRLDYSCGHLQLAASNGMRQTLSARHE